MTNSKEILTSVLKTAQMGQVGIRSVLDAGTRPALREALADQLQEYDSIESEAHAIASQRGWELQELDPMKRFLSDRMVRLRLDRGNCDSKIAAMMIQGNTKGMIKSIQMLNHYTGEDRIRIVAQKLLDCETANIRQMKGFL